MYTQGIGKAIGVALGGRISSPGSVGLARLILVRAHCGHQIRCSSHKGASDPYPKAGVFGPAIVGGEVDGLTRYPSVASSSGLLRGADYFGTVVFAVSGAVTAGFSGMDVLGATIVGTITAIGGGTVRDAIILHKQPFWVEEHEYFLMASAAAMLTFCTWKMLPEGNLVKAEGGGEGVAMVVGDAVGVGAFAVIGAQNALRMCVHPAIAAVCGMVTATFGGLTRDVLCSLPLDQQGSGRILHSSSDIYASTALAGASAYILARKVKLPVTARIASGMGTAMGLRYLGYNYDIGLPTWTNPEFCTETKG
mmetsp:Transcript_399/g.719  ORF Transcript_399/g.719 Transcript_399/m.719 type:complete len:308 (-) Transcript_399:1809-2732(-)